MPTVNGRCKWRGAAAWSWGRSLILMPLCEWNIMENGQSLKERKSGQSVRVKHVMLLRWLQVIKNEKSDPKFLLSVLSLMKGSEKPCISPHHSASLWPSAPWRLTLNLLNWIEKSVSTKLVFDFCCRFSLLSLEADHSCRYDYVELRDGDSLNSPVIGRFCGNQLPQPIKSSGNVLHILFTSDGYNNFDGFVLTFQESSGRYNHC